MFPSNQTETGRLIYSVSQLTREIKAILESSFPAVWVEGEMSNFKLHYSSGHIYFDLKDSESIVHCAFFRNANQNIKFELKDGLKVICFGRISVYNKNGQYQLYVDKIEPKGIGELQLAFEQLKKRLENEGLFDAAHKVPLPLLPSRIGIITSPTGAVIRDMLHVLRRRHKDLEILIYPVKVQGDGAASEIASAVADFNRLRNVDVLILARGGGSLEDLWSFNEEVVARAIYDSEIPLISAVGHEVDYTISDFVADLRAPTPSAAAEMVVAKKEEFIEKIEGFSNRMRSSLSNCVSILENRLEDLLGRPVFKYPFEKIESYGQRLDDLLRSADKSITHTIEIKYERLNTTVGKLEALSPLAILSRGYSITLRLPDEKVIRNAKGLRRGDMVEIILAKGKIVSEVKEVK